jgi:hypothetical protein
MKFLRVIRAILREIFDEAAYERFCVRTGLTHGQESYAKFRSESDGRRIVKCC